MRIVLLILAGIPAIMAFRTLGLLRDWIAVRHWARHGGGPPFLSEPAPPGLAPSEAEALASFKLVRSALATAAAVCFAVAGGAAFFAIAD